MENARFQLSYYLRIFFGKCFNLLFLISFWVFSVD